MRPGCRGEQRSGKNPESREVKGAEPNQHEPVEDTLHRHYGIDPFGRQDQPYCVQGTEEEQPLHGECFPCILHSGRNPTKVNDIQRDINSDNGISSLCKWEDQRQNGSGARHTAIGPFNSHTILFTINLVKNLLG